MTDTTKPMKSLTVVLATGQVDRYAAGTEWEGTSYNEGALIVERPDGSRKVYAPGYWVSAESTVE